MIDLQFLERRVGRRLADRVIHLRELELPRKFYDTLRMSWAEMRLPAFERALLSDGWDVILSV